MPINPKPFTPNFGQVVICDFGDFPVDAAGAAIRHVDHNLPPEMVKQRLVVVLNSKITRACVVVPLSTTFDEEKFKRGWHVELDAGSIPDLHYFRPQQRWAKADMVQQVSTLRLHQTRNPARGNLIVKLTRAELESIQRAVIKVLGAGSMILAPAPVQDQAGNAIQAAAAPRSVTPVTLTPGSGDPPELDMKPPAGA